MTFQDISTPAGWLDRQHKDARRKKTSLKKNNVSIVNEAKNIKNILQKIGLGRVALENSGNIGKSYRRHDEIGTPICITVDFETLDNKTVTVRDRDTMLQKRLGPEELINYYKDYLGY